MIQQDHTVTVFADTSKVMAYKQDCFSLLLEFLKFPVTFCLKKDISDGKRLVHDQDFRIDVDCHRKGQTHKHTARV